MWCRARSRDHGAVVVVHTCSRRCSDPTVVLTVWFGTDATRAVPSTKMTGSREPGAHEASVTEDMAIPLVVPTVSVGPEEPKSTLVTVPAPLVPSEPV